MAGTKKWGYPLGIFSVVCRFLVRLFKGRLPMKNLYRSIITLAIVSVSPFAIAEDLAFTPRLTTGYMNYKLEIPSAIPAIFPPQKVKEEVPIIGAGATLSWNRLYLDAYGQISANASDDLILPILNYNKEFDGDVKDYSLTAGVAITDNLSIYVGYKYNKLDSTGNRGSVSSFQADGYFLGASYGWVIQDSGVLALNLAFADLDGTIRFQVPELLIGGLPIDVDETSNAQGLSYGVSWKSNINKNWGYSIAFDANQYNFKDIVDKRSGAVPGEEINQDIFTVRVSVSYLFD
jgi:hypothetical protein